MRKLLFTLLTLLVAVVALNAHDLFLKFDSFFLPPNTKATVALINGTFDGSENAIARDRMADVSIVGPETDTVHPDTSQWYDEQDTAYLNFETGASGTYVIGVSTAPRVLGLSANDFNDYLKHDGVLNVLADREQNGMLEQDAREQYAKHVKAILQVGDTRTDAFTAQLGYPVELVPLQNPYMLAVGDTLEVEFLKDGEPVGNQLIYASYDGHHGHGDDGGHQEAVQTQTDEDGLAQIPLSHEGRWYVRLIHMEASDEADLDYVSEWTTLTFEIRP